MVSLIFFQGIIQLHYITIQSQSNATQMMLKYIVIEQHAILSSPNLRWPSTMQNIVSNLIQHLVSTGSLINTFSQNCHCTLPPRQKSNTIDSMSFRIFQYIILSATYNLSFLADFFFIMGTLIWVWTTCIQGLLLAVPLSGL